MEKNLKKYFLIFLVPTLVAFIIAFVIPFIWGIVLSFCNFTTITDVKFIGIDNYVKAFRNADFINALGFTIKIVIVAVLSVNIFAFLLALLLTKGIRGTNVFRTIFFMPNLIGGIVLGYIWQAMLNGILSRYDVTLLVDPKYGFWGIILLVNWQLIGYIMIIYIAGIQGVPKELYESAYIDGADKKQALTKITLPMIMPSIVISFFLTLTGCFKIFDQNLALTGGGPANKTAMLSLDIYNTFYSRIGFEGVGQSKAVVFFIIVGVISLVQVALLRRKEVEA